MWLTAGISGSREPQAIDNLVDLSVDGRSSELIFKKMGWEGVECIDLAQGQEWINVPHGRDKWQAVSNGRDNKSSGSTEVRGIS
jgi:hypothetical protein